YPRFCVHKFPQFVSQHAPISLLSRVDCGFQNVVVNTVGMVVRYLHENMCVRIVTTNATANAGSKFTKSFSLLLAQKGAFGGFLVAYITVSVVSIRANKYRNTNQTIGIK